MIVKTDCETDGSFYSTNHSSPDVVEEEGGVDEHHVEEEDAPGEAHPEQVDVRPPAVSAGLLHIDTGVIHRHAEREDCVV